MASNGRIRPFDVGGFFPISNWVFDHAMPRLSNAGWRVLCVAIRKTWGWADPDTSSGRQEWDRISYSQFQEASGLRSRASVAKGIEECIEAGYLIRRASGRHPGTGQTLYSYALNVDYETHPTGTESVPATGTEAEPAGTPSVPAAGSETEHTKRNKIKHVGDDDTNITNDLVAFGFNGAQKAISQYGADRCREVLDYARRAELGPGWIQVTLRNGEPVPGEGDGRRREEDRRRRYIEGEYAGIIEH